MKYLSVSIIFFNFFVSQSYALEQLASASIQSTQSKNYQQEARSIVKKFSDELKSVLKPALKAGGAMTAIDVCSEVAPSIAKRYSQQTQWNVGRTSLKYRNPQNAPDQWEREILENFEQQKQQGVAIRTLEYTQVVMRNGQQYVRYMKAIPIAAKPCLACHGQALPSALKQHIDLVYPKDRAIDFKAGDIRGAFTLIKALQQY